MVNRWRMNFPRSATSEEPSEVKSTQALLQFAAKIKTSLDIVVHVTVCWVLDACEVYSRALEHYWLRHSYSQDADLVKRLHQPSKYLEGTLHTMDFYHRTAQASKSELNNFILERLITLRVMLTVYCLCEGWSALYYISMTSIEHASDDGNNVRDLLRRAFRFGPLILTYTSATFRAYLSLDF